MNNLGLKILNILVLLILFVVEKSFLGIFGWVNYFSLLLFFVITNQKFRPKRNLIYLFFVLGLICDWYFKRFTGLFTLGMISSYYLYYLGNIRLLSPGITRFLGDLAFSALILGFLNNFTQFPPSYLINCLVIAVVGYIIEKFIKPQ